MNLNKLKLILVILGLLGSLFFVGCAPSQTQDRQDITPQTSPQTPLNDETEEDREMDLSEEDLEALDLEGGPERTERQPSPVSINVIQQNHPDKIAIRGGLNDMRVALTFDDGPDPRYTPKVLDVLKEYDVKGTFFLLGARAKALSHITKRIHEEGHDIGNHTYWHPKLDTEKPDRFHWELTKTQNVLQDILGFRPSLFRPPYGAFSEEMLKMASEMGYSTIAWSVDSVDWMQLSPEQIQKNVLSNVHPGAIILMHDGGNWDMDLLGTVNALHEIIPRLKEDGIEFVTVSELLNIRDKM
jgi:polysaccharide deacetylase family sporulation protein PdaB